MLSTAKLTGRVDLGNFTPSLSQNRIPIFGTGCESLPSYGSSLSNLDYPDSELLTSRNLNSLLF